MREVVEVVQADARHDHLDFGAPVARASATRPSCHSRGVRAAKSAWPPSDGAGTRWRPSLNRNDWPMPGAGGQQRGVAAEIRVARPAARGARRDGARTPSAQSTPGRSAGARARGRTRPPRPCRPRSTTRWSARPCRRAPGRRRRSTRPRSTARRPGCCRRNVVNHRDEAVVLRPSGTTRRRSAWADAARARTTPAVSWCLRRLRQAACAGDCNPKRAMMPGCQTRERSRPATCWRGIRRCAKISCAISRSGGWSSRRAAGGPHLRVRRPGGHPADRDRPGRRSCRCARSCGSSSPNATASWPSTSASTRRPPA